MNTASPFWQPRWFGPRRMALAVVALGAAAFALPDTCVHRGCQLDPWTARAVACIVIAALTLVHVATGLRRLHWAIAVCLAGGAVGGYLAMGLSPDVQLALEHWSAEIDVPMPLPTCFMGGIVLGGLLAAITASIVHVNTTPSIDAFDRALRSAGAWLAAAGTASFATVPAGRMAFPALATLASGGLIMLIACERDVRRWRWLRAIARDPRGGFLVIPCSSDEGAAAILPLIHVRGATHDSLLVREHVTAHGPFRASHQLKPLGRVPADLTLALRSTARRARDSAVRCTIAAVVAGALLVRAMTR